MGIFRIMIVTLSLTLLVACGGGGGSAVTPATTPTDSGGNVNPLADLARFAPTTNSSPSIQAISRITTGSGAELLVSGLAEAGNAALALTQCANNSCMTDGLKGGGANSLTFTNNDVGDISLISSSDYFTNSRYESTVTPSAIVSLYSTYTIRKIPVTLARGSLAGTRATDNARFESQSFAGWLDGSVFGTTQITIGEHGSEEYPFVSYIAGVPSGSNPPLSRTLIVWEGAAVASIKANRTFILGDAEISVSTRVRDRQFVEVKIDDWRDVNGQAVSDLDRLIFGGISLIDGTFKREYSNSQIEGRFYGTNNLEVGGFFNTRNVTGAFGGTREHILNR